MPFFFIYVNSNIDQQLNSNIFDYFKFEKTIVMFDRVRTDFRINRISLIFSFTNYGIISTINQISVITYDRFIKA